MMTSSGEFDPPCGGGVFFLFADKFAGSTFLEGELLEEGEFLEDVARLW